MLDRRSFVVSSSALAASLAQPSLAERRGPTGTALSPDMPIPLGHLPSPHAPADPSLIALNHGWLFHEGDIPVPAVRGNDETYAATKAGNAQGAAGLDYDDSDWTAVQLPHDWAIAHPVESDQNDAFGYRRRGVGWYRRYVVLPADWHGQYLELQLGGMANNATVWFNGVPVAHSLSGYVQQTVDLTPYARFGDEPNTIAVRVDGDVMEGWWYEGAGLYRDCWLAVRPALHIATDGVHATPIAQADGGWQIPVTVTLGNAGATPGQATVEAVLQDANGRTVARSSATATAAPLATATATMLLPVARPNLWSPETPTLYTMHTRLVQGGKTIDSRRTEIGFRIAAFDPATGFHLNGTSLKIKGVCIHQDHAGVGVAVPAALMEWRVRRLKQIGANAIRFTHGTADAGMLDACDRLGMLVMAENRHFDPSPDYLAQLEWMVRRDRNRPSIILWSVLNEEPMQGSEQGYEMVRRLAAAVKALDDTRPVTAAMNDGMFTPLNGADAVDVVGFNYKHGWYDRYHKLHPDRPLLSTEDTSAVMTRGEWTSDTARNVLTSYDTEAPEWGLTHHKSWRMIGSRPFIAATFVWTGFDYHGEPTPLPWPAASSSFGILDLCGFAKMAYHLRRAQWITAEPIIAIGPHWNWAGREGQPIKVMVPTNVEAVALSLNGQPIGRQTCKPFETPEWQVPFAPGTLEAIGYRGGREVVRASVTTAGRPATLRLTPDRPMMLGDGADVQPISVDLIDAAGLHVPTANDTVTFGVEGGEIVGVGNGNPNDHDPEQGNARKLFNGFAQVLVRSLPGAKQLVLTARVAGLPPARVAFPLVAAQTRAVAVTPSVHHLGEWRRTPFVAQAPDARTIYPAQQWRSLSYVRTGRLEEAQPARAYTLIQGRFMPRRHVAVRGGTLHFAGVIGRAELWVDGQRVATKSDPAEAAMVAPLPAGEQERVVTLLLQADAGEATGLSRSVAVW
ncbi:beta-galactosidase [Sphingomonas sp. PP-CE-3A-406]|uniref:beta-galactosidase GalA n=1 Tax=Sphingomonas sp. PP-CE-3A-406 TaxID=2135659 RepID=UPI000EF86AFB|nr:beta-galactosidase GalA [Sphingomonas sp. PP-CE-3A-406]RMB54927.1 beta-galactosidase [Sphingomonas sp. PP-CE-3A-406]